MMDHQNLVLSMFSLPLKEKTQFVQWVSVRVLKTSVQYMGFYSVFPTVSLSEKQLIRNFYSTENN